jgi:hypothetical protein
MFGILMSAVGSLLGFVVRGVVVKFVLFTALFYVTSEFLVFLTSRLPDASSLNGAFGSFSAGVWYFLDYFGFSYGFPLLLSAWVLRFMIRRIPFIG